MELFVFSFLGMGVAFGAMALGVALGRSPLRRGCGTGAGEACEVCTRPCPHRRDPGDRAHRARRGGAGS